MTKQETYPRFSRVQRLEHWVMFVSFTVLAITGLPQRYALSPWADVLIRWLGGIEAVRIVHRVAAVVLIVVTIFHFAELAYKILVLRVRPTILPGIKDIVDLVDSVRHNLGMARQHPKLPRYSFAEKMEYWAVMWGSLLMIATGFMLWNPIAVTRFLPGAFIPAALMAHSAEAVLAVLAVLVWHVYFVHLKAFNRSMFDGRLTREEMEAEHAAELEEIESGVVRFPDSGEAKRRRERLFVPISVVVALVAAVGLYWFVTFEQTAIATVPPGETAMAYVPATPTPTNTPTATLTPTQTPVPTETPVGDLVPEAEATPPADDDTLLSLMLIPHPLEGREDCLMCHAEDAANPFPPDHVGRPSSTCLVCHGTTEAEEHLPASVKHDLEGRENCLMCHAVDLLPASHKTAAFSNNDCLLCHVPSSEASLAAPPGEETGEAANTGSVRLAAEVLSLLEANCATCHGDLAMGGLRITEHESLVTGGDSGPVIVAGDPDHSLIVSKMAEDHGGVLEGADLQVLIDWIAGGSQAN